MQFNWHGVFPAVTTKFTADDQLDSPAFQRHIQAMLDSGCHGIIVLGTLGENSVLSPEEKRSAIQSAAAQIKGQVPLLATIAENTTQAACQLAADAKDLGADGLMLLPPMLYKSDNRETVAYLSTVAKSTDLPIMLYNNPVAYGIDLTPDILAELADCENFVAIKESSDDVRRITDIRNLLGDRYRLFCGVDNLALESLLLGADGWVAGLVCAFPRETVAIYQAALAGNLTLARELYRWFMPLLHLDVSTKLVQNIKLAEVKTGLGTEHVRAPRLPLAGEERRRVEEIIDECLASRPELAKAAHNDQTVLA
ncbi:Dihydrodipicolinate synthase family protein [Sulfidibacter corallicola]|uniref:Dihydrodipicolinate synthase family protein n=1 Tax=Sulfidibacter corallicola TaxID=2818388 RepID=A0A8A4TFN3_SULCO|nr:dihydrodipicolinate synthase family protein [Sulfidibacter corallicola]QTD47561.1 dihydrodipicolinate synthase family protein [Sulfidibacter corallicola]